SRVFFFQAEDGIRDLYVTGVQTCALPIYLQPVTHDGRVLEQRRAAARIEARHPPRVEAGERTAVARALAEDRRPREPRLGALEREHLEEPPLVVHRAAPLLVVVADVVRVGAGCPSAAALAGAGSGARAQGSGLDQNRRAIGHGSPDFIDVTIRQC